MKRFSLALAGLVVALLALTVPAHAQTVLNFTTTTAAVTERTQQVIPLTSVSNIAVGDLMWWDGEISEIQSCDTVALTCKVTRGRRGTSAPNNQLGNGRGHPNGVVVVTGPARRFAQDDVSGACTYTNEQFMPHISVQSGRVYDCIQSRWTMLRDLLGVSVPSAVNDNTSTASGTVQSTEYVLNSITIPKADWALSQGVKCQAFGTGAANANAKNIKFYFGATSVVTLTGTTDSAKDYLGEIHIQRSGASTQIGWGVITSDVGAPDAGPVVTTALTEAETAAIVISLKTANTAAAAASATGKGMRCELY